MKTILGTSRYQIQFSSLDNFIAADNAVRIVDAFVEKLDLKRFGIQRHKGKPRTKTNQGGAPCYDDKVLLKLYLYGYLNKVRSSRKLEQECYRNVELRWLMQQLIPNYHTIADFRKNHSEALKNLFKLYVQFLDELNLLGKQTLAVDGSKFRAVNSRKNNYNQKKIDKHQAMINEKAENYLKQLDELDNNETDDNNEPAYRKEEVEAALQRLMERKIKYDDLQQQLDNTEEKQISTSDSDSRALIINKNIVEVSYNIQTAVDAKHNLLVHTQATSTNDGKALHQATIQAKENMNLAKGHSVDVLSDKGYHTGAELQQCHNDNIETFVAFKEQSSVKHLQKEFLSTRFVYNKEKDSYTCPAGQTLTTLNTWHHKKGDAGETSYRFKTYRTAACKSCSLKKHCTKLNKRIIHRSEFQDAVDRNNENIRKNPDYYKRRQSICEHPFGTIKRQWGYTYTLMKGLKKVNGEMNLIMLLYNIKRTLSILGFTKMMQALQSWKPDYSKLLCRFLSGQIREHWKRIVELFFLSQKNILQLRMAQKSYK